MARWWGVVNVVCRWCITYQHNIDVLYRMGDVVVYVGGGEVVVYVGGGEVMVYVGGVGGGGGVCWPTWKNKIFINQV